MAKKGGSKPRKSGKSGSKKSQASEKDAPAREQADKQARPSKNADILCQFCNKPMKNDKTKKLHERSCKAKAAEPPAKQENGFESALIQLKDQFNDERESLMKSFQDKEEHMQRELDEVKTVLRMEIDRHRKELERIQKVEREVSEKQPVEEKPAPEPAPAQPPQPAPVEHPIPQRTSQPRAIDLIPMHVPTIPKKRFIPTEEETIPDLDEDYSGVSAARQPGLDRDAVEALVKDILKENLPEKTADNSDALAGRISHLSGRIDLFDTKLERNLAEIRKTIEKVGKDSDVKRYEKELEKVSEKVQDIMEDSGYGESLSVSKIPPTILEIVYQAILDDIHIEIIRTKGYQDAEKVARSALEEVRLKTSGSELFKFDGRKIVTDNLARSIEANLISAKQIQTTYDVLLDKLLETVPHHKAKNFKGMIKVKSQEFAVDRATRLSKDFARLEKSLESTSQMVAAMAANFNARSLELHEVLNDINEKGLATKADRDEVDSLRNKLEESNERAIRLGDELALLRAELEMKQKISEADEPDADEPELLLAPGEAPSEIPPGITEDGLITRPADEPAIQEKEEDIPDISLPILNAIEKGLDSKTAIMRETGLEEDVVVGILAALVEQKKIIEKKAGKRLRYTTLENELEMLNEAERKPEKPKKGKKAKQPKPEPEKEPEMIPEPEVTVDPEKAIEPEPVPEEPEKEKKAPKKKAKKPKEAKEQEEPKPAPKKKAKKPKEPEKEPETEPAPEEPKEEPTPEPVIEPEEEPVAEPTIEDELPVIKKTMEELSEDELEVLNAMSEDGMTMSGIQSRVGKHMKRFALLRALRVLIDSGYVGIIAKGRMELYQRINVQQMDKSDNEKKTKEVK